MAASIRNSQHLHQGRWNNLSSISSYPLQSVLIGFCDEKPNLWWQHAGRAVLSERSETLGSEASRWGLAHRRYYRRLYSMYYLRHRSCLYWLLELLSGCPNASRDALIQLEAQLGDGEIAQFRWWVWATEWAVQRQHHKVYNWMKFINIYLRASLRDRINILRVHCLQCKSNYNVHSALRISQACWEVTYDCHFKWTGVII